MSRISMMVLVIYLCGLYADNYDDDGWEWGYCINHAWICLSRGVIFCGCLLFQMAWKHVGFDCYAWTIRGMSNLIFFFAESNTGGD